MREHNFGICLVFLCAARIAHEIENETHNSIEAIAFFLLHKTSILL